MKSTFVRAIVLTITVAGLVAPSMTSAKSTKVLSTSSSWIGQPTPLCAPSSGQFCGMQ